MEVSRGLVEDGIIVGNSYDKYGSRNPLVRLIMKGFAKALDSLVAQIKPCDIHEVGCGEGYWVINWHKQAIKVRGSDVSKKVVKIAKDNAKNEGITESLFTCRSIYDLVFQTDSAELVVCCEVLEHLYDPDAGLEALSRIANPYLIVSVPREPLWSLLNMLRGKYLSNFGNTPGHLQRWTKQGFILFVLKYFDILEVKTPLPWTMLLCRRKAS